MSLLGEATTETTHGIHLRHPSATALIGEATTETEQRSPGDYMETTQLQPRRPVGITGRHINGEEMKR